MYGDVSRPNFALASRLYLRSSIILRAKVRPDRSVRDAPWNKLEGELVDESVLPIAEGRIVRCIPSAADDQAASSSPIAHRDRSFHHEQREAIRMAIGVYPAISSIPSGPLRTGRPYMLTHAGLPELSDGGLRW